MKFTMGGAVVDHKKKLAERLITVENGWRLGGVLFSTLVSIAMAVWTIRSSIASHDQAIFEKFVGLEKSITERISEAGKSYERQLSDQRQETAKVNLELAELHTKVDKEIVPRAEHQAHWDMEKSWHDDLKQDLHDLRTDASRKSEAASR